MSHSQFGKRALKRKAVRKEYDQLESEFRLLREMLGARKEAGPSQAEAAGRMATKPPAVTGLESSLASGRNLPSIATLKKYAEPIGLVLTGPGKLWFASLMQERVCP